MGGIHQMLRSKAPKILLAAGLAAATAICVAPASSASEISEFSEISPAVDACPMEWLTAPADGASFLTTGDRSGRYQAGVYRDADGRYSILRWVDGIPQVGPRMSDSVTVSAVNGSGSVVGDDSVGDRREAWRHEPGASHLIGLPAPGFQLTDVTASAINDEGWAVGSWVDPLTRSELPVIWTPDSQADRLPLPDGYANAVATGIDADGTVVGHAFNPGDGGMTGPWRTVVWRGGDRIPVVLENTGGPEPNYSNEKIAAGVVVADDPGNLILRWAAGASDQPEVAATGVSLEGFNTRGSILVSGSGYALLKNGESRPLDGMADRVQALTDDDMVYGQASSAPVRWDCRA
jgi:hypothetical protein